ncbi:MAG: AsmA family protein [Methylococcales bacterium]
MPKLIKITLSTIAAVVIVMLVVIGLAPFVINPNDFKEDITNAVRNHIGRDLTIDGDLKLTIFPWLGVSTGKMTLSNAQGFADKSFATVAESKASLKLTSLLTKQLEVSEVVFKDLSINLITNAQGVTNWADLSTPKTAKPATEPTAQHAATNSLAAFAIGGIHIENAHIDWDDQQAQQHIAINNLDLKTGPFTVAKPVAVALSFKSSTGPSKLAETIQLNTDVLINEQFDTVNLAKPLLQITVSGDNIPNQQLPIKVTATEIAVDLQKQNINIPGLQINAGEITLSSELNISNINTKPVLQGPINIAEFNLATALKFYGVKLPVMHDAQALSKLSVSTNLQADTNNADLQNLHIKLDDTNLTGAINVADFKQPIINFNLNIDHLDADRYLSADAKNTSKAIASPAVAVAAAMLPIADLRKLNAHGNITLNTVKVNGLTMQGMRLDFAAKQGIVKTNQSSRQFYQGDYSGSVELDVTHKQPTLAVNEKIKHLHLDAYLKDLQGSAPITGVLDATTELNAQGHKADQLKATLTGSANFAVKDTVLKGFNLQKIIDNGKAILKDVNAATANSTEQTLFSELSGSAAINNGVIQSNNLMGIAAKLRIDGKGSADINTEKLDVKLIAKFQDDPAVPQAPNVIINIAGTFDKPSLQIDVAALLKDKNNTKVIENLLEHNKDKIDKFLHKLDKKLGFGGKDLLKKF